MNPFTKTLDFLRDNFKISPGYFNDSGFFPQGNVNPEHELVISEIISDKFQVNGISLRVWKKLISTTDRYHEYFHGDPVLYFGFQINLIDFVTTEHKYVQALTLLNDYYKPIIQNLAGQAVVHRCLPQIEELLEIHKQMLKLAEGFCANCYMLNRVLSPEICDRMVNAYTAFSTMNNGNLPGYVKISTTYPQLNKLPKSITKLKLSGSKDVRCFEYDTIIHLVLQRLTKYRSIVDVLISKVPEDHQEFEEVKLAYDKINKVAGDTDKNLMKRDCDHCREHYLDHLDTSRPIVMPAYNTISTSRMEDYYLKAKATNMSKAQFTTRESKQKGGNYDLFSDGSPNGLYRFARLHSKQNQADYSSQMPEIKINEYYLIIDVVIGQRTKKYLFQFDTDSEKCCKTIHGYIQRYAHNQSISDKERPLKRDDDPTLNVSGKIKCDQDELETVEDVVEDSTSESDTSDSDTSDSDTSDKEPEPYNCSRVHSPGEFIVFDLGDEWAPFWPIVGMFLSEDRENGTMEIRWYDGASHTSEFTNWTDKDGKRYRTDLQLAEDHYCCGFKLQNGFLPKHVQEVIQDRAALANKRLSTFSVDEKKLTFLDYDDEPICNDIPTTGEMILIDLGGKWDDFWPIVGSVVGVNSIGKLLTVQWYQADDIDSKYGIRRLDNGERMPWEKIHVNYHYFCKFELVNGYLPENVKTVAMHRARKLKLIVQTNELKFNVVTSN